MTTPDTPRTPSRARILDDIRDAADALTDPTHHVERVPCWDANRNKKFREHKTTLPGLLQQLADIAEPGAGSGDGGHRPPPGSRPPVTLDAVSLLAAVRFGAARRCADLGVPSRGDAAGDVRGIVGAVPRADHATMQAVRRELRSWQYQAEIVTGWRTPPIELVAPCPAVVLDPSSGRPRECAARGTLLAIPEAREARCVECGTTWDEDTVGVLARHVAAYRERSKGRADLVRATVREAKERGRRAEEQARHQRQEMNAA